MQSTHNTISSNIAIRLGCHGYNITYTQDQTSFDWAMRDAELLLKSGKCKTVLVGCHDESTPLYRQLMQRLGYDDIPSVNSKAIVLSCGK
jgi:3-oxoacyl-(acyl-carrier-protein) synthase